LRAARDAQAKRRFDVVGQYDREDALVCADTRPSGAAEQSQPGSPMAEGTP
jgi:hypothetical protein